MMYCLWTLAFILSATFARGTMLPQTAFELCQSTVPIETMDDPESVGPIVTINQLATGDTLVGSFFANYSWQNCTGVATVRVIARQNNVEVGRADTSTTDPTGSQVNKLVETRAQSGTTVEVTVYALDASGKEIAKSAPSTIKVK